MASLFKRRKNYWVSFYLNGQHIRKSLKTTSEKVAKAKVRRIEYELEMGDLQVVSKLHLTPLLQTFCRHLMATRTYKSYKNDFSRLRIFFGPICEELEIRPPGSPTRRRARPMPDKYEGRHVQAKFLEDVTPLAINRFIAAREEQNSWAPKTVDGEFWQPKTKRNRVVPISDALFAILSACETPMRRESGCFVCDHCSFNSCG